LVELQPDAIRPLVQLDQGQFEAAILNLVTNARDAMAGAGRVVIATADATIADRSDIAPGPYVRVTVSDTRPGMDAAPLARPFDPFLPTKDGGAGPGLGLSQVYGFAQQAGGAARIQSRPGQGPAVELLLPACQAPPAAEPAATADAPPAPGGEVVLVV